MSYVVTLLIYMLIFLYFFVCLQFYVIPRLIVKLGKRFLASVVIGGRYLSARSSRAFDKRAEQALLKGRIITEKNKNEQNTKKLLIQWINH